MKRVFRIFISFLLLVVFAIVSFLVYHYHSDLPISVLKEKYANPYSKFVEVNGMDVHYQRKGKGHPFVLIHGFSGHVHNWREWMEHLANDFDLIAMDLPGFGLTGPHIDRDYSMKSNIAFLDQFLSKIGVDTFYLAGNSMGGGIAWSYALARPDKVKKLVLVDASGYPRKSSKSIAGFELLEYRFLHPLITKITPEFIIKQSLEGTYVNQNYASDKEVELYMDMLRRKGNRQVLIDKMTQGVRKDRSAEIKQIKTPTLIIWGDKDNLISVENAYKFEQDIPSSSLIVYPDIGHIPMDEAGKQSAKDVRTYLLGSAL